VSDGRASGLRVQGQSLDFERVICNMDVFFAYHKLLPAAKKPERVLRQQKSTSALIFYWGIKKTFPELNVHNIFFSDNYQAEFAALEAGGMHEDPTVYVNLTSRHVQGDAPEGCENWFVMINAPYDRGQDWEELTRLTRARTLEKLSRLLGTDVSALIEAEYILTPPTIESRTGSHLGALYGTSSNNRMAAFLRHANFSSDIRELYFAGGSVHPGGGIPLCLLSARIVDECCSS
jgi:phytoene dehydrogenase-like protein